MGCFSSKVGAGMPVKTPAAGTTAPPPDQIIESETALSASMNGGSADQELVSKRATDLGLDRRLTLGLSVDAIEKYIAALPAEAVEQCNRAIPIKSDGTPKFPNNTALNGYVNQWHIARWSENNGDKAYCEALLERGDPGVGVATVFVSWFLDSPLATLVDAMRQYLQLHPELPPDSKFWVCDFVIRQRGADLKADVGRLGDCVRAVGHTVLLMEPWHDPRPLRRAYCIKEVYHTQASGARFEFVMGADQQAAFETALVDDFDSIMAWCKVDVRMAECRNPDDTKEILGKLDGDVGLSECNRLVLGLLRGALLGQGARALSQLKATTKEYHARGYSLLSNLARLQQTLGHLTEAAQLYREAIEMTTSGLGDEHALTLSASHNYAQLLMAQGDLKSALHTAQRIHKVRQQTIGEKHPNTLTSLRLVANVSKMLGLDAASLYAELLAACPDDKVTMNDYGQLLHDQGKLNESAAIQFKYLELCKEDGERHPSTLSAKNNLGALLEDLSKAKMGHPDPEVRSSAHVELGQAEELLREVLEGRREVLGAHHPQTMTSMNNLASLLRLKGDLSAAVALMTETLEIGRQHVGRLHPNTLATAVSLAVMLKSQGDLAAASVLLRENLHDCILLYGPQSDQTFNGAFQLREILMNMGKEDEADNVGLKQLDHGGWVFNPPSSIVTC